MAKERVRSAEFQVNDIYEKIDDNFDIILCTETLEHLLCPDKVLRNFIFMTNSSGIIFLTVPDGRKDNFGRHINFWSPESWKIVIEQFSSALKFETGYLREDVLYAIFESVETLSLKKS